MYWPDSTAVMTAALISSSIGGRDSGMGMTGVSSEVDATVLAAIVEQGFEARVAPAVGGLHAAHEYGVVATRIGVDDGALELGERVLEHRDSERALAIADVVELLGGVGDRLGGEAIGDGLLVGRQDVHREACAFSERLVALRVMGDADQDQGRVEGHAGEGAGGETRRAAMRVHRGDDGHARAEVAEDATELVGSNHPFVVSVPGRFFKFSGTLARTLRLRFLDGCKPRTLYFSSRRIGPMTEETETPWLTRTIPPPPRRN